MPASAAPHFTIRALLRLTAVCAVTVGVMARASQAMVGIVSLAAYVAFLVAVLLAAFSRGRGRAMAGGFAILGIGYLGLVRWCEDRGDLRGFLGTTQILCAAQPYMGREVPNPQLGQYPQVPATIVVPQHYLLLPVGQCLWAISLGGWGAIVGWRGAQCQNRPASPSRQRAASARRSWLAIAVGFLALAALAVAACFATWATPGIVAVVLAVALLTAVVLACFGHGRRRAICTGFACGGLAYAFVLGVLLDDETMDRRLGTTQLLMAVHPQVVRYLPNPNATLALPALKAPNFEDFIPAAQGVWTLLFALCGGAAGLCFHRIRERQTPKETTS